MDDQNNRNFFMAIALSIVVLVGWQLLYAGPKMREEQARRQEIARQAGKTTGTEPAAKVVTGRAAPAAGTPPSSGTESAVPSTPAPSPDQTQSPTGVPTPTAAPSPGTAAGSRAAALARSPRLAIETKSLRGSIALKGGRVDDLTLVRYKVTTEPDSPSVVLFSPSGAPAPYYAEYGWSNGGDASLKLPTRDTLWKAKGEGPLVTGVPVTLEWDNGQGLLFRRIISLDENYMFTIRQEVENTSGKDVTLYPYALISRHGTPKTAGFWILHEGLLGVLGDEGYQTVKYKDAIEEKVFPFSGKSGWLGITDKYWASVIAPDQKAGYKARFTGKEAGAKQYYQADYLLDGVRVPAGGTSAVAGHLFAGAKQVLLVDSYKEKYGIEKFDLLIDWGWFYFITKPLFRALDFFYKLIGNFGIAILIVTVMVKLLFFPLANKSYVSMGKMKKLQPEMKRIQERFKDDRTRQQQAMMELYKNEKVNPMSGCLPIVVQIPVFFALYKVLFVSIEMRHAPFFGWIQDLSARDPTSLFNLFGLISLPFHVPDSLSIGVWPLIMGVSMWVQMKLNPAPQDEIQKKIFAWMPVFFTFLLARFPAGLVIYWTWNNILSVIQQSVIMSRQGVKIELFDNIKSSFGWFAKRFGSGKSGQGAPATAAGAASAGPESGPPQATTTPQIADTARASPDVGDDHDEARSEPIAEAGNDDAVEAADAKPATESDTGAKGDGSRQKRSQRRGQQQAGGATRSRKGKAGSKRRKRGRGAR